MREGGRYFFFFFLRLSDPDLLFVDVDCIYSVTESYAQCDTCMFYKYICTNTCPNIFHV